ncbi:uncharacterized protein LOC124926162 [Impatiens glandulifera]|uniref:uncharacterized protein LOC124926162 n=1 Tax=Impatiens glandulifera TaxID=253017 RepID=UPI001FB0B229|nr:uncharacterized protein LOC124926162 [Impatiens glandulifera]
MTTNMISSHLQTWSLSTQEHLFSGKFNTVPRYYAYSSLLSPTKGLVSRECQKYRFANRKTTRKHWKIVPSATTGGVDPSDSTSEDDDDDNESSDNEIKDVNDDIIRKNLERMIGKDDSSFSGIDLANLIRNKYGRSYDVQLIKKEFMGRNLLAMNVMWKYREQRSFPLTEEEYILRLDDVANNLRCWGAVSHIRNSLEKSKERPRIGKAVSIFIDMDESGGRAKEWIYR